MKKIVTLLLLVVFSLSLYAYTEPLVMLSLLSPAMLFSGESYAEEYDVSLLNQDSAILLTLPSEMQMASISLADITSDDFMTMGKAMIDLAFFASKYENSEILDSSGRIRLVPSFDLAEGTVSMDIIYDDVSLLYRLGSSMNTVTIDGSVNVEAAFYEEPLVTVYIRTEDILVNGDSSLSQQDAAIRILLNEDLVSAYMKYSGKNMAEMRYDSAAALLGEEGLRYMGLDDEKSLLDFASSHSVLDILDAVSFIGIASYDSSLDELDIVAMLVQPEVSVNGEVKEEINLRNLLQTAIDIRNFTAMIK